MSLIAGDQKRLGTVMSDINKITIKHRLTFNHKLANSMSEKAKQGKVGGFLLVTKGQNTSNRSIKSINKYFQLTNSVGMVYLHSDERYSFLETFFGKFFWEIFGKFFCNFLENLFLEISGKV